MCTPLDPRQVSRTPLLINRSSVLLHGPVPRSPGTAHTAFARRLISNINAASSMNVSNPGQVGGPSTLRGLAAIRARPFLHVVSFGLVHQSIAWAALPPLFYFFQATGAATSLLAGPQVAWVLSRPVPAWLPAPFVDKGARRAGRPADGVDHGVQGAEAQGFGRAREVKAGVAGALTGWIKGTNDASRLAEAAGASKELERIAQEGKEAERRAGAKGQRPLLVEDVVEQIVRKAARTGYSLSKVIYGRAQTWGKDGDAVADDTINALEGKGSGRMHISDLGIGDRVRRTAGGVSFREILDGAAAYIVVKALLPARIPLSLFLTPKVARVLARAFR